MQTEIAPSYTPSVRQTVLSQLRRQKARAALNFILTTVRKKTDIPIDVLRSKNRSRDVIDIRRIMCYILRTKFQIHYEDIGLLFGKDHSTIVFAHNKHLALQFSDKKYSQLYSSIADDIERRILMTKRTMIGANGLILKDVHSNEKQSFFLMMNCFENKSHLKRFMNDKGVDASMVVYQGATDQLPSAVIKESVASDEKRYMQDVMKSSLDITKILSQPDRHYLDYDTCEYSVVNDPDASFKSALELFDHKDFVIIFFRPRD